MSVLNLSQREQDLLAEFCTSARRVKDNWDRNDKIPDIDVLGMEMTTLIIENSLDAQDFDQMYDKLHRSGANS